MIQGAVLVQQWQEVDVIDIRQFVQIHTELGSFGPATSMNALMEELTSDQAIAYKAP